MRLREVKHGGQDHTAEEEQCQDRSCLESPSSSALLSHHAPRGGPSRGTRLRGTRRRQSQGREGGEAAASLPRASGQRPTPASHTPTLQRPGAQAGPGPRPDAGDTRATATLAKQRAPADHCDAGTGACRAAPRFLREPANLDC